MPAMCALRTDNPEPRGRLLYREPMARHTVWAVGGPAERYYEPADVDDLAGFLAALPDGEPIFWIGLGSNLLVRDGGMKGTVIAPASGLKAVGISRQGRLRAEAGVPCAKAARVSVRAGLAGGEFLAGIPGTIGGALAMNAGAFGGEIWPVVHRVEVVDRGGTRRVRTPADYQIGYRSVVGPSDEWFVAAEFTLNDGGDEGGQGRIRELLERRAAAQPVGQRSCGSVFRNPPDGFAAQLIDSCGLKGMRIGGAVVSEKHANFIINDDEASAADIEALVEHVAAVVEQTHGVRLVREVRIVGEALVDEGPASS